MARIVGAAIRDCMPGAAAPCIDQITGLTIARPLLIKRLCLGQASTSANATGLELSM